MICLLLSTSWYSCLLLFFDRDEYRIWPNISWPSGLWNSLIRGSSSSFLGKDKSAYIKGFHDDFKSQEENGAIIRLSDLNVDKKSHDTSWNELIENVDIPWTPLAVKHYDAVSGHGFHSDVRLVCFPALWGPKPQSLTQPSTLQCMFFFTEVNCMDDPGPNYGNSKGEKRQNQNGLVYSSSISVTQDKTI